MVNQERYMKLAYVWLLRGSLALAVLAGCKESKPAENRDNSAIRDAIHAYQEAYNRRDAEKLATFWSADAFLQNPVTGEQAEGREEIAKFFKNRFESSNHKQIEIAIKSITFPSDSEAIEKGIMKTFSEDKTFKEAAYQVVFVKEKGKWLIDEVKQIDLQEATSNFEKLQELEWMIGNWQDNDPNVDITFDTKWEKNKNFLKQHFLMQIYDQDALEGDQIIAWDEADKHIRSWVFDSNGGFGEGVWEHLDKSWYANMKYILSDGSKGYAKNIYTPIDANSYTFASTERELDGQVLPDIDAVKVIKVKSEAL